MVDINKEKKLQMENLNRESKKELYEQVSSIIENKSNSYTLIQVR